MTTFSVSTALQKQCENVMRQYNKAFIECTSHFTGLNTFKPQPSDVVIASFMKSGTTFTQQMLYQILVITGRVPTDPHGNDLEDISEVVPFIEVGPAVGILSSVHPYHPRVWKTHAAVENFASFPDTVRYIYCVRNGKDVAPSMLDFTLDWILEDEVRGEELRQMVYFTWFMRRFLRTRQNDVGLYKREEKNSGIWFEHVKGWIEDRGKNILLLVYEDVVKDISGTIRHVAEFLDVHMTSEQVAEVAARCDRKAMVGDPRYNDVHVSRLMGWREDLGVRVRPEDAPGFKHMELPDWCWKMYDEMFQDAFGCRDYNELISRLHDEKRKGHFAKGLGEDGDNTSANETPEEKFK